MNILQTMLAPESRAQDHTRHGIEGEEMTDHKTAVSFATRADTRRLPFLCPSSMCPKLERARSHKNGR